MDGTELRLVRKEPGKAYLSDMLWLPKDLVRPDAVKKSLEYWRVKKNQPFLEKLWDESVYHIITPREFISPDQYVHYPFPFIDLRPSAFPVSGIKESISWRDDDQKRAWEALSRSQGGILNLACGKGKTVLALKKIAALGSPALIVVNDGVQFEHWLHEIDIHLSLPEGEKVGSYQSTNLDWKRPITVATIQTLAKHSLEGKIPEGFSDWFGSVWFDEVHHLSAPLFVRSAPLIRGLRFGLTATAKRLDGMQWVYEHHIGKVFYSDLSQDLVPYIYFQETDVIVPPEKVKEIRDKRGDINVSKCRSFLANNPRSLDVRAWCIQEALSAGRKILGVSHSKDMLHELHERFDGSELCVSETPQRERIARVKKSQLAFAIAKLGVECLNDASLDALFILTPYSSPNDLQQMLGRIQRPKKGKPHPIAVVFDDKFMDKMHGLTWALRNTLKKWKYDYQTLNVPVF